MPDDQKAVVQRMIDAGESEENIATVIQHFKTQGAATPTPPLKPDINNRADSNIIGVDQDKIANLASRLPEPFRKPAAFVGSLLGTVAEGLSAPESVATMGLGKIPSAKPNYLPPSSAEALQGAGRAVESLPGAGIKTKLLGRVLQKIQTPMAEGVERYAPNTGGAAPANASTPFERIPYGSADAPPLTPPASPPAASGGLSAVDRAGLVKQGYPPEVIQRIEGQLKPIASHAAPAVEEVTAPLPNTVDAPMPSHPLTQPRATIGAEAVGKQQGLSKQAVRDVTGPVLGEEAGAASPILPRGPSAKIIGKLKEMGPQGTGTVPEAERDAYVMRANSDKARAQIKAYLDALRAVGFTGAAGVTARQALTDSMAPQDPR